MVRTIFIFLWVGFLAVLAEGLAFYLSTRNSAFERLPEERFFDPKVPGLPYLLKPNSSFSTSTWTLKTNSMGLRENLEPEDFEKVQHKACERVLVIGSSYSMGYGVNIEDSIPHQIETILNSKSKKCFRLINASLEGFPLGPKLAILKYLIPIYRPTQVVLEITRYDHNDPWVVRNSALHLDPIQPINFEWLKKKWQISSRFLDLQNSSVSTQEFINANTPPMETWDRFFLYRKVKSVWNSRRTPDPKDHGCQSDDCLDLTPKFKGLNLMPYSPVFLSPMVRERMISGLRDFIIAAKEANLPLMVWTLDSNIQNWWNFTESSPKIIDWGDLLKEPFEAFKDRHHLPNDFHLTPEGNRMVAEKLAPFFLDSNLKTEKSEANQQYWQHQAQVHKLQSEKIRSSLNFLHRKGAHQILGGLESDLRMNENHQKINLLVNGSGCQNLVIEGVADPGQTELLGFRIVGKAGSQQRRQEIKSTNWKAVIPCSVANQLIDLEVTCLSRPCKRTQILNISAH